MDQDRRPPTRAGGVWTSLAIPPIPDGGVAHEAFQSVLLDFENRARRGRSILRLVLVAVMVLAVFAGTNHANWAAQFAIVGVYGAIAILAALHPYGCRPGATIPMMLVDIAAICLLQLPSVGSYLMLGLLAFLPFFIATHLGRWAATMSVTAIVVGGLTIISDTVLRRQMTPLQITTVLVMLGVLCLCSYVISAVQQHRLQRFAQLVTSRELLLADVMTAGERERRLVAEALHDGPLQTLLAARQDLREAAGPNADPAGAARAADLISQVAKELRQLTKQLHPSVLEEVGLEPAVRGLAQTLVERTGATVQCRIDYPDHHSEDAMIYGAARELLTNVARHAQANNVWLTLHHDGETATLEVRDDGVGIDPAVISRRVAEGHIGLASQRARVETLTGSWEFLPIKQGTWVRVTVPIHHNEHSEETR